jgi:hypothetical protein
MGRAVWKTRLKGSRIRGLQIKPRIMAMREEKTRFGNRGYDAPAEADETISLAHRTGGHGGGDPSIVAEFVRYVRHGGAILTWPVAARYAVAAGCMATESPRNGSTPMAVAPLDGDLRDPFDRALAW